jgi:hypothetical protein
VLAVGSSTGAWAVGGSGEGEVLEVAGSTAAIALPSPVFSSAATPSNLWLVGCQGDLYAL